MSVNPQEFQQILIDNGFPLPKFGADGYWGGETEAACKSWFKSGKALVRHTVPPVPPPSDNLIPADWMPDCNMVRIIVHWTAGGYTVSATDKEHYHIIIGGDCKLVRGNYSIKANVSTSDADGYAAHTKSYNTGSIGISAACMADAKESPFDAGDYPITQDQWLTLAQMAAELCREYGIPISRTTVMQHGEVEKRTGVKQDGKWDICKLPWQPSWSLDQVTDNFRSLVTERL